MAKFIGSKLEGGNQGEDYFVKKLIEYFDESYVVYRNRPIFGTQFDVCLFAPRIGIIIYEVKGWNPDTIKEVKNGDNIVIRTIDEETGEEGEEEEGRGGEGRGEEERGEEEKKQCEGDDHGKEEKALEIGHK